MIRRRSWEGCSCELGTPGAPRSCERRKGFPSRVIRETRPGQPLDCGLLVSRTRRESFLSC